MLPAGILFLSALVNNTLFVQVDSNYREAFICLSVNNVNNETWPLSWNRMVKNDQLYSFKINENVFNNSNSIQYKLKKFLQDGRCIQMEKWQELYVKPVECELFICVAAIIVFLILLISTIGYLVYKIYLKNNVFY